LDINQRSYETRRRSEYMEEHCSVPELPACEDFIIVPDQSLLAATSDIVQEAQLLL